MKYNIGDTVKIIGLKKVKELVPGKYPHHEAEIGGIYFSTEMEEYCGTHQVISDGREITGAIIYNMEGISGWYFSEEMIEGIVNPQPQTAAI